MDPKGAQDHDERHGASPPGPALARDPPAGAPVSGIRRTSRAKSTPESPHALESLRGEDRMLMEDMRSSATNGPGERSAGRHVFPTSASSSRAAPARHGRGCRQFLPHIYGSHGDPPSSHAQ